MAQPRTRTFNLIDIDNKKLNNQNYEISSIYSSKVSFNMINTLFISKFRRYHHH
jgi:hypothetical protein